MTQTCVSWALNAPKRSSCGDVGRKSVPFHWADGGDTNADNLILLCRFHHGRIHTTGWSVEKTGPGQATITHHDHTATGDDTGTDIQAGQARECGCSDWRTDADMDAEHATDEANNVFPTGLYRTEWSTALKPDLDSRVEEAERHRALAAIRAARAKCRARFTPQAKEPAPGKASGPTGPPSPPPPPSHREPIPVGSAGDPPF